MKSENADTTPDILSVGEGVVDNLSQVRESVVPRSNTRQKSGSHASH
jgi:hypothetical protein